MTHEMRLDTRHFDRMARGEKTVEMRLFDEKRQKISVGDSIVFTDASDASRQLSVRVVALHRFANFADLYRTLPLVQCGYTPEEIALASPTDMEIYYPIAEQNRYGVVGIEILPIDI